VRMDSSLHWTDSTASLTNDQSVGNAAHADTDTRALLASPRDHPTGGTEVWVAQPDGRR